MDFYRVEEETPLLSSIHVQTGETTLASSPKDGSMCSEPSSSPRHPASNYTSAASTAEMTTDSSPRSGIGAWRRRVRPPPEFQLSVDKVSFLYSPRARHGGGERSGKADGYMAYGSATDYADDELAILDPYFDVTDSRLQSAFEEARPDQNDELTYDGFRAALEAMGIRCTDDAAFLKLVGSIDRLSRQRISFAQFDAAVHKLKLVHLFDEPTVRRMAPTGYQHAAITVSDFSRTRLQQFTLKPPALSEFFTTKRPSWVSVRWINVNGRDSLNLKRLAIKYRLHPLAIEDTLEMHERPKFDRYENHLFLVFPVLRMEILADEKDFPVRTASSSSLAAVARSVSTAVTKQLERHSSFRQRATSISSRYSVDSDDENDDPFRLWIEHVAIFIVGDHTVITVKNEDLSNIWQELNRRLAIPYSKLRHNKANFLVYAVLDVIVDQVTGVVDSITDNLMELEDQLERLKHKFSISRLRFIKNELFRLPRLLKPAREVLKNLIESREFDESVTAYVRDVHDHVVQVLDDIELHLQMCRLMSEDYREAKANQMNYVIYTLTIVTTVFLPAQFLTGVYGMNFDNMPELHERYGYALFWVFVLAIGVSLQIYFRYKKWI